MRAPLAKAVRKEFARLLKGITPRLAEAKGEQVPSGCSLYAWDAAPGLRCFILLQFHQHEDWFTLELAVSRSGHWPAYALATSPESDPAAGDVRFRLGHLWAPPQQDVWWELAPRPPASASFERFSQRIPVEQLLERVPVLVADAVERFSIHALPYVEQLTRRLELAQL